MARNAIDILSDEGTLARYRVGALQEAARFNVDRVLPLYESLYEEVLADMNGK